MVSWRENVGAARRRGIKVRRKLRGTLEQGISREGDMQLFSLRQLSDGFGIRRRGGYPVGQSPNQTDSVEQLDLRRSCFDSSVPRLMPYPLPYSGPRIRRG